MMKNSFKILSRNNFFYNYFLRNKILEVKGELSNEELLERIIFLAKFSWRNHPGYYSDGRLENILFDYGKNLDEYIDKEKVEEDITKLFPLKDAYTMLHVATELFEIGGHTRILYQFLKRQKDRNQIVVLTNQEIKGVPQWFLNDLRDIPIVTLNSISSLFERAYILRHISRYAKEVILHHHPYDAVPVIAFSHDECPLVLLENHAHSWFWLGPSIIDVVLAFSTFHKNFTLKTRPVNSVRHFPFHQINDLGERFNETDKVVAKERLKLSPNTVCIITIGTDEKFIPNAQYNFYKTAKKVVERFENVELFIIGISESSHLREKYHLNTRRIHFMGFVSDPSEYYKAADICLEALPQPSIGATGYAALIGMACPLLKYGAGNVFNTKNFWEPKLYDKYIGNMRDEREYLEKLEFLINNPKVRIEIAEEIREEYLRAFSKDVLAKNIKEVLDLVNNMKHAPRQIPDGFFFYDADSAEIAETSSLQDLYSITRHFKSYLTIKDRIAIISSLSIKFIYFIDILKLTLTLLKNRIKTYKDFILCSTER